MTMTDHVKHANELSSETSIIFLSRRYGAKTDPMHTHELVMRAEHDSTCREYVFQTEKGRAAAHSLLSQLMAAQALDELLGLVLSAEDDMRRDARTEHALDAGFAGTDYAGMTLHELGETGVHVYDESDACAADGEFGSQL